MVWFIFRAGRIEATDGLHDLLTIFELLVPSIEIGAARWEISLVPFLAGRPVEHAVAQFLTIGLRAFDAKWSLDRIFL